MKKTFQLTKISSEAGPLERARGSQRISLERMMADWLGGKSAQTIRSYKDSMDAFKRFCRTETEGQAVTQLLALSHGEANLLALEFKNWLKAQKHSPGSINTRLSALRSLVAVAHLVGMVPWQLAVRNEKNAVLKDTRGPGADGFEKLLAAARDQKPQKAARDEAILWLLYGQALRRNGVASLDVEHVDFDKSCVHVLLKGHTERTRFTVSQEVIGAVAAWLKVRGSEAGALFPNCDRAHKGNGRITGGGLWSIISTLGRKIGLITWPHALRHAGITTALDETDGNMRAVQRFSGHKTISLLTVYDDNREDLGGKVAIKVGHRHRSKKS